MVVMVQLRRKGPSIVIEIQSTAEEVTASRHLIVVMPSNKEWHRLELPIKRGVNWRLLDEEIFERIVVLGWTLEANRLCTPVELILLAFSRQEVKPATLINSREVGLI